MMFRPSISFSGAKCRCCFSAYLTPKSYLELKPLDLAWDNKRKMVMEEWTLHSSPPCTTTGGWMTTGHITLQIFSMCVCTKSYAHHSSQSDEWTLDLSVVDVLKQIVGLEDVMRLQAVLCDGTDKVPDVFQLRKSTGGLKDKRQVRNMTLSQNTSSHNISMIFEWTEAARGVKANPPLTCLCVGEPGSNRAVMVGMWKGKPLLGLSNVTKWWHMVCVTISIVLV